MGATVSANLFLHSAGCPYGGFIPVEVDLFHLHVWKPSECRQNLNYCSATSHATSSILLLLSLVLNLFTLGWAMVWSEQLSKGTLQQPDPWNRNGGKLINSAFNALWFVHTYRIATLCFAACHLQQRIKEPMKIVPIECYENSSQFFHNVCLLVVPSFCLSGSMSVVLSCR